MMLQRSFSAAIRYSVTVLITALVLVIGEHGAAPLERQPDRNSGEPPAHTDPRRMRFEPVKFNPPDPERVVLENGLVVYLLEDHELPLVTINAMIRTGGWLDPPDKVGLAAASGMTMRTGGTQTLTAAALDEELERLAAQLSVGFGPDSGSAMLDVLKKDLDRGLRLFADVLRRPAFEPARVELAKLHALETIRRRQDQPQSIASREFAKLIYGADHPYARESSEESIANISREDLVAFHAATVHPNGMLLGVAGDFDKDGMLALLREVFGDWPRGTVASVDIPDAAVGDEQEVRFIAKETAQTHLRAGHLTVKENHPDYPALVLLNDILGGGSFRGRLFQDVRTRQGLAYSVSSVVRTGTHGQGVWGVRTETKSASTHEMITRLVENLGLIRREPVEDDELEEAKEAFVNSFVFSFTSPASIVARRLQLEYDGLPKEFYQQLRDRIVALSKDDLLRAAQAHLHPDRLKILAVGPPETARVLSNFGAVQEIKLKPGR